MKPWVYRQMHAHAGDHTPFQGAPMSTDPEMARRGRIGALVTSSRYDGREITAKARATFIERFVAEAWADADARGETITDEEAHRRGEYARKAHYARMAAKSVKVRAERAGISPIEKARAAAVRYFDRAGDADGKAAFLAATSVLDAIARYGPDSPSLRFEIERILSEKAKV